jgi:5'-3' exonuclease
MVVHIKNPYEDTKTEDIAKEMIGKRTFMCWPFLQEGLIVVVSDSLFKYEKITVVPRSLSEVASEDPRFAEKEVPLSEEFPEGSKIFFLGEHAYGVAAQVSLATDKTLPVILAVRVSSSVLSECMPNHVPFLVLSV